NKVSVAGIDSDMAKRVGAKNELDHGAMVPLYFLDKAGVRCQLVQVTMGLLPRTELYAFGVAVQQAARLLDKRVVMVASGDLSHRLTSDAPAGYSPEGQQFDLFLKQAVEAGQFEAILAVDEVLADRAGECGLRPIIMLLGCLDGFDVEARVLSYEGPFGVGYMVAGLEPQGLNPERELLKQLHADEELEMKGRRHNESQLVKLARETLEYYVRTGRMPDRSAIKLEESVNQKLPMQAGVFVSLKKHGQLRGCIGTTAPTQPDLVEEIRHNAVSAGTNDPRFWPVEEEELEQLVYSVDVLSEAEPISGPDQLDIMKYGVIVRSGRKSGLLLPNLEGVDTIEEQVNIAKQKAGIQPGEDYSLERFEVVRYY
ncbi:MAG TPA: AmmeMemoRadiSam system protein A, partial [Bacillota bacterium]|nr:AmmeMemoRadiSam system protein A [Bacillota bacterium]